MRNKTIDLENLARNLDITPTMHKYAVDRYTGISEYLDKKGINAKFYPQGSFRTGTVVRPMRNGIEADYDIDVVCELAGDISINKPCSVKHTVGDALKSNDLYSSKLLPEDDRCWTLSYAEVTDGIGLNLDVVPATKESEARIRELRLRGILPVYANDAIEITEKKHQSDYVWQASNPSGFGKWFDDINSRFLAADSKEKKRIFLAENRKLFSADATIDDVPDYYIRSSLQRVIQLFKRHRDIYYAHIDNGDELIPSSIIITSLSAKVAKISPVTDLSELLKYVAIGLKEYSSLMQGKTPIQRFSGEIRNYIEKQDQHWKIANPVNPDDNYADQWTDETAEAFFSWLDVVELDLANIDVNNEKQYITGLQTSLGKDFVNKKLGISADEHKVIAKPLSKPTKPWRNE